ncbi:MAG: STAS domain-containing protein [Phycisphaeraceae bacterium]|nr:STAS domain-containing protein [Phycisphaeraceae bacterium]
MAISDWSESILLADLQDEPSFSEDLETLIARLEAMEPPLPDVVLNMAAVHAINSSNIAQMLTLRKRLLADDARLKVCSVGDTVWSVFLVTGLDKVFDFNDDVLTSLASLQVE